MLERHTLKVDPMGAVRLTQRSLWTDRAKKYASYKEFIRLAVGSKYVLPETLHIEFELAMPKSWSNKKSAVTDGSPHKSKPDIDNLVKGFMDAFGVDDSHVHTLVATKRWAEKGSITVHPTE